MYCRALPLALALLIPSVVAAQPAPAPVQVGAKVVDATTGLPIRGATITIDGAETLATTDADVPWWRVVNAAGRLVPGHERQQAAVLREEDVVVRNGHVKSAPHGRFSDL